MRQFKSKYKEWKLLQSLSGFGFDPTTGLVTADEKVWENYIKVTEPVNIYSLSRLMKAG